MKVEIITPDVTLYSGDQVDLLQLPGVDGSFELLNHHAPLIAVLSKGKIKLVVHSEKEPLFFEIKGGVVEVVKNKVLVLAE